MLPLQEYSNTEKHGEFWFQQDGAMRTHAQGLIHTLKELFPECIISRLGNHHIPQDHPVYI